jgi:hypothetical protein
MSTSVSVHAYDDTNAWPLQVVYCGPGVVEVQDIADAKLEHPLTRKKIEHGVILRVVATNICGSDQHMGKCGAVYDYC